MLGDEPRVLSGREDTFSPGKDTGRYWDAGARNVHWVVCTTEQVEIGVRRALRRVTSRGVLVEGTSLLKSIPVDYAVMVCDPRVRDIKSSAVGVMARIDAVFVNGAGRDTGYLSALSEALVRRGCELPKIGVYFDDELQALVRDIRRVGAISTNQVS